MQGFESAVDLSYKRNMTDVVMMETGRGRRVVGFPGESEKGETVGLSKVCCGRRKT